MNKATIKKNSDSLLVEIADVFKQNPQIKKVSIEGHTDLSGNAKKNQKLSEERAQAVAAYVIEADPELEEYITTKGFSYDKPIFAEDGSVDMDALYWIYS